MRRWLAALFLIASLPAQAATQSPFSAAAFAAAQAGGKPILIEIDAPWCPNCAKQRPILAELAKDPAFADLLIFKVDFDSEKSVVRAFHATLQSTLIAFHGKTEQARSVGVTDPAEIRALVARTGG